MSTTANPIFERRRLRLLLRRLREELGLSREEAARAMGWSASKLTRIELGDVKISTRDLNALVAFYQVTDSARLEEIQAIAKASRMPAWWSEFRDLVSPKFAQQLEYEASASKLYIVYNSVIPGLLQTREYARAVIANFQPEENISRLVDLRMRRQQIFDRDNPPEANFIVGEAALHSRVGGVEVMREQLNRLLALMEHERINIEIVPFKAGAHPGMIGPFEVMAFDDGEGDVASFESPTAFTIIREEPGIASEYRGVYESLQRQTLKDDDAADYIRKLILSVT
jgi:transcriptional regulator with XRE-family HTH domain